MTNRKLMMAASMAMALLAGTWRMQAADAQVPGFKRVELQRHDLSAKNQETVVARGEFEAGAAAPRHTHPGEEIGYVLEGELLVEIDGQPAQKLKAGDTFFIPAGKVHTAKNTGKAAAAVLSTYIVEKGKPLATPAPAK
jgi:quercetin dioxygenase-like cupin family protein